ncbi:MAG: hypothetical protein US30_C0013G0064 [Candidatus Moranbacteria bacterium GW2011_GWF2_36_839]|nr:MAG: hypothetical protein US27_C0013G0064 [Candidatus Moranbacteria bacterium GW2011_GWF1_36_78]KKQ16667.1 MAG: hypothetical protein US30_C0013G0064 [Candidatus Moranbacteria bacterium GW2011_GWF2_36_839]
MKDAIMTWIAEVVFSSWYFFEENYFLLMGKEEKKDRIRIEKNSVY